MRRDVLSAGFVGAVVLAFLGGYYLSSIREQKSPPVPTETEAPAKQEPVKISCDDRKYVVVPQDGRRGLWGIAEKQYGNRGYLNLLIAEKNSDKYPSLKENPNFIQIGWVLTIPCCLCDLPPAPKPVVKKVKKVVTVVLEPQPCPACPKVEILPTLEAPPVVVAPPEKVSPPEAPKPPPTPTPAPAPAVVAPQPIPQQPLPPQVVKPPVDEDLLPPEHQSYHESGPVTKQPAAKKVPDVPVTKQEHWGHGDGSERRAPGSMWNIIGTSPLERDNWIDYFHVDQGILLGKIGGVKVVPYIGLNAVKDSKGYSWNNRVQGEVGVKFVKSFTNGVIDVGTAFAAERRFGQNLSVRTRTGIIGFAGGWHGWQQPNSQPSSKKFLPGGLPGAFQWRVGNISPFEKNNVIGSLRADQGFTLAKLGRVSLIPTATFQGWTDSDKNPWNRRYMYGGGLKIAIPVGNGIVDLQGGYMCAKQYSGAPSSGTGCGPAVSVNFWTGWHGWGRK